MLDLKQKFALWRRRTLPASIDDIHWRHESVVRRLEMVEEAISCHFPDRFLDGMATPAEQREILDILRLLEPKTAVEFPKVRVGSAGDGGYVQLDDLKGVRHAFSFGVSDNDSWDLAMAEAGIPIEQFDHSIEAAPSSHPLLRFHRKMIAVDATPETATLPDIVAQFSKSDEPDLILKIDIESCEWDVFDQASDAVLSKFTQILCELHDLSKLTKSDFRNRARRVITKLIERFAVVHVHGNNCATLRNVANIALPDVLEITFANRSRYAFVDNAEVFPTALDAPNDPRIPDIALGSFRF